MRRLEVEMPTELSVDLESRSVPAEMLLFWSGASPDSWPKWNILFQQYSCNGMRPVFSFLLLAICP